MAETPTKVPVKSENTAVATTAASAPWAPLDTLRREIDRVFDSFGFGALRMPFNRPAFAVDLSWPREAGLALALAFDVAEKDKEFEITAELPGLDEKSVEVKVNNGTLTIRGEKKDEREKQNNDYHLSERRYGAFMRSFRVPEGVDVDKIEANFAKGVLTVKLPKTPAAQNNEKTIVVKAA